MHLTRLSDLYKDPIVAFSPLKRQKLIKVSAFELYFVLFHLILPLPMVYVIIDIYRNGRPKSEWEREPKWQRILQWFFLWPFLILMTYVIGGVVTTVAMCIGTPIIGPCILGIRSLINYTFFHGSYDDNTVIDRVGRWIVTVVRYLRGIILRFFRWILRVSGLSRNAIPRVEEIEV